MNKNIYDVPIVHCYQWMNRNEYRLVNENESETNEIIFHFVV